ncbi:MAG: nitrite/sulfite reductase [Planctomycetales bacterium]|nr:nitrite/sulfite reductase [Planctomycetales bacterium]
MDAVEDTRTVGNGRLGFADAGDVDLFVETLGKFERGEISPDEWRAFRLVNGVYGQRQDGVMMIRVKIPQGILTAEQLRVLADVAERFGTGKGHVTTRQNVQFHFVKPGDVEEALRALADAGLTTREACGNSVRNVTTCPYAGISAEEPFDPTPHAEALTRHLLRGAWSSTLPRKFKIAFGGCCPSAGLEAGGGDCIAAAINDLGFLARVRDGRRGFRVTIGGGLATLPREGAVAHEFLPAEEILEVGEAVVRVFHRIGNRRNKAQARLKWAIEKIGFPAFLDLYRAEREAIRAEGGRPYELPPVPEPPAYAPPSGPLPPPRPDFGLFARDSVRLQRQRGFSSVLVRLPLGDVAAAPLRTLADLVSGYGEGELRTTHDQDLLLRFVPSWRVPALHAALAEAGLARPGARTVADVTSCPGAWSCKLAVTASRGLGGLLTRLFDSRPDLVEKARALTIKVSGCPNGCGQHLIAGIGFQGGVRKVGGRPVPQYHLFLGGGPRGDGTAIARLVAKIPARRIPEAVEGLIGLYDAEKSPGEEPNPFFARVPPDRVRDLLRDLGEMDEATARPEDFADLGEEGEEAKPFEVVAMKGECAA